MMQDDLFMNKQVFCEQITPIQEINGYFFKREDLFEVAGVCGAKARTCYYLAQNSENLKGLTTAGSRQSPQVNIVAHIAKYLGVPCAIHTPQGILSDEVKQAVECGAVLYQHKAGYNSVIIARSKQFGAENNYTVIPFGMDCYEAVKQTEIQVQNLPAGIKRIVIVCGSGMNLSGLLWGLKRNNIEIPVVAIKVGAEPEKRLNKYAPYNWQKMVTIIKSDLDYHTSEKNNVFEGITFDPIYEAKCLKYLQKRDLFWVIGVRATVRGTK